MNFEIVNEFENNIKNFFGAPYAVSVDSCTHGIELCLRLLDSKKIIVPKRREPLSPKNTFLFFLKLKQYKGIKLGTSNILRGDKAVGEALKNSNSKIVLITSVMAKPSIPSIKFIALMITKNTNTVVSCARIL